MKKTNPLKIVEIENYANNLRKELGIPSNSFFPVLEVMEKFHVDGLLTIQYLEDDKDKQVIKFISGIKGCGRTTLLDTYKDYFIKTGISKEQLISINLEDISYQDKNYKELYFYIKNKLIESIVAKYN